MAALPPVRRATGPPRATTSAQGVPGFVLARTGSFAWRARRGGDERHAAANAAFESRLRCGLGWFGSRPHDVRDMALVPAAPVPRAGDALQLLAW
jgi:hypothetical protein